MHVVVVSESFLAKSLRQIDSRCASHGAAPLPRAIVRVGAAAAFSVAQKQRSERCNGGSDAHMHMSRHRRAAVAGPLNTTQHLIKRKIIRPLHKTCGRQSYCASLSRRPLSLANCADDGTPKMKRPHSSLELRLWTQRNLAARATSALCLENKELFHVALVPDGSD